jgi:uncharacterized membrane protein
MCYVLYAVLLTLMMLVCGVVPAHAEPEYTLLDLGTSIVHRLARTADVVVGAVPLDLPGIGATQAVIVYPEFQLLGLLPGTFGSEAFSVAGAGTFIVGSSQLFPSQHSQATLWLNRQPIDLGTTGGRSTFSSANAVNTVRTIVGIGTDPTDTDARALVWTGGPVQMLPDFTRRSDALAINEPGDIAGWATNAATLADECAFWAATRGIEPLGWHIQTCHLADRPGSIGFALNDAGQVVGITNSSAGSRGFVFPDYPTLSPLPGDTNTQAFDINNHGVVAGTSVLRIVPDPDVAFEEVFFTAVRFNDGMPTDLNTLVDAPEWTLEAAISINDNGLILTRCVQVGDLSDEDHVCLLVPISPAPAPTPPPRRKHHDDKRHRSHEAWMWERQLHAQMFPHQRPVRQEWWEAHWRGHFDWQGQR